MTTPASKPTGPLTNRAVAGRLLALAQQLQSKGENAFKVKAYRRAAETIAGLSDSIAAEVHAGSDLTRYSGIGKGIAAALREIVTTGSLGQLDLLLADTPPEVAALNEYPRLDPKRVLRAYKKLKIASVQELKERLETGEVGRVLGQRDEQHFRQALTEVREILLEDADPLARSIQRFLLQKCGASRAEAVGAYRRRVEVISELSFVVVTDDFPALVEKASRYGGGTPLVAADDQRATFTLSAGISLILECVPASQWGVAQIQATGSAAHVEALQDRLGRLSKAAKNKKVLLDETSTYRALGLTFIPPELREGRDEVELAAADKLPTLVAASDIRGELHAHTTSSDGMHTIEEMAAAAGERGYDYLGVTDHSQSLKIARGLSQDALWEQIHAIDQLNERGLGVRLLKSAEVDILADGSLDYPGELLAELDYTICSIHSKFRLGKPEQTERIMRAMDNPHFKILGHTTGRLLLRRSGYEVDWERLISHAREAQVSFEINASPDRLDLSADNARRVHAAGIKIAVCTDAHHVRELDYMRCGIDVARRAGLEKKDILNCLPWPKLSLALKR
jgi:DNA polymerase (family 10)